MKPTENYIDPLIEFLQDNQVYFEKDPMSPNFMAVQWLADEAQIRNTEGISSAYGNGLELNDKLIQRFAVLTLDYALNRPMYVHVPTTEINPDNVDSVATKQVRDVNNNAADFDHYAKSNTIGVKEADECNWEGVICAEVGPTAGQVEEIRFAYSGLTGTIPPETKLLQNMKILDIAGNELHGSIPESLYSIKELKELYLYQNQLTGTISNQITNWYNM